MRLIFKVLVSLSGIALSGIFAWCAPSAQNAKVPPGVPPLVLAGGTVVDLTNWGHSAHDIQDSIVIIREGRITDVGTRAELSIPKNARIIDCTGKYLIPGLVDGLAGMNSQAQANANLFMGVTTIVARGDERRKAIDFSANPSPHLYLIDSIGVTDNWSRLANQPAWSAKLKEGATPKELRPEDTARQLSDTIKLGTRVLLLGHALTAANTQWIISRAHQMGLITYGEFVATPYSVGIEAGVDALPHMGHYELGVIPDELQKPLVDASKGSAAITAYDYAEHLPPTDQHLRNYARFIASHHAVLMPVFSAYYLRLPGHRNLWKEPAATILNPSYLDQPPDHSTGDATYPLPTWTKPLPNTSLRWMQESQRKKADQSALRLWQINQTIFSAYPHYLAASGAPASGTMPGISLHIEMELLVRMGLSPREAVAAATSNYSSQFGWNELGLIAPGRRADILILDADPVVNIWNARRISTLVFDGNLIDREALLRP